MIEKAKAVACMKHKGLTRADGREYVVHPFDVYNILSEIYDESNRQNVLCASLLHDTLEDTNTSIVELQSLFNEEVASLVVEVTNATYAIHTFGKAEYLSNKMINMTDSALAIKLADRLSNIRDLKGYDAERIANLMLETATIMIKISTRPELKPYHKKLIQDIGNIIVTYKSRKQPK